MKTDVIFKAATNDIEVRVRPEGDAERAIIAALKHQKAKPMLITESESDNNCQQDWIRFAINVRTTPPEDREA